MLRVFFVSIQVAEDTWKTEYELKKKERTSMLANMTVQQHAYSIKQKPVLSTPLQFQSSSPPSVATSTKKNINFNNYISTPDKTELVSKGKEYVEKKSDKNDDGVCSSFQDTEATSSEDTELVSKKRKWFASFFG